MPRAYALALLAATMAATPAPRADQIYLVTGDDTFVVGTATTSHITYNGTERLHITADGSRKRFRAEVRYHRSDDGGAPPSVSSFTQEMRGGTLADVNDDDPDFLTVLNQPFAIQLDPATLRDLRSLHGRVPFDAPSPITGGTLHGSLSRGPMGRIGARDTVGVRFDASGPMQGPLPDKPEIVIDGTMHMRGTAFYAQDTALLLGLDAQLTIEGTLHDAKIATPVHIVYTRAIRAQDNPRMLQPAALPTGAGAASQRDA